ncbi:MAG TPA: hemerythrin domain-containing protein [Candidatus Acidoferrales bacterium]|nr:hemerythrin domain-containing protein [Candidatus Acidoferrales bacterium]
MHRQLKLIHQMLRNDLTVCRELAADVATGAPSAHVADRLAELQANSPLWNLQINCLYHCRIVHMHHHGEDADMFPALRRSNPELGVVVDRLESDHRAISVLLDNVESLARKLDDSTTSAERDSLVIALRDLGTRLLEHLAFEEENIAATMRSWATWPA